MNKRNNNKQTNYFEELDKFPLVTGLVMREGKHGLLIQIQCSLTNGEKIIDTIKNLQKHLVKII